jgi:hypothetical protein
MTGADRRWSVERPHTLVVACADGRLQEATDAFLHRELGLDRYDRFYVPGGGGALASSGRGLFSAQPLRRECEYLVTLHEIARVILLFHGPAEDGPADARCADYRRKFPHASAREILLRQYQDFVELRDRHSEWAGAATVSGYRAAVDSSHQITFAPMEAGP